MGWEELEDAIAELRRRWEAGEPLAAGLAVGEMPEIFTAHRDRQEHVLACTSSNNQSEREAEAI